jgi:hypothetical protein
VIYGTSFHYNSPLGKRFPQQANYNLKPIFGQFPVFFSAQKGADALD